MKKTTEKATSLVFSTLKGVKPPFSASNFKFIAFFVVFSALILIPTSKISASYTLEIPTIENLATSSNFSWSSATMDLLWDNYKVGPTISFKTSFHYSQYPATTSPEDVSAGVTEPYFKNYFPVALPTSTSNGAHWWYMRFGNDYYYSTFYKGSEGWVVSNEADSGVIFYPSYPIDCFFTIVSTSTLASFNATGTIEIATSNLYNWFNFSVIADNINTLEKFYFSTTTDLVSGDIFHYSIPISLPEGAYKISYLLQGGFFETPFFATHWCEHTGIGSVFPSPTWTEITEAEFLGLEDCSSYPLLERLVCDLKNAIKKIFVPSPESINGLKTTIEALKNKAPMSYISITKNFLDDVKNGINNTADLDFKILNKTGAVSFAFWDRTTDLAGQNQSFTQIFKTFFIFLIVFSFLIWAIFYIRKIFK
jgi:hypothetical protein